MVSLSIFSAFTVSILWAGFSELISDLVFQADNTPHLAFWVFMTSFPTGLFAIFSQLAIREHRYRDISVRSIYQSTATGASQAAFGTLSWGSSGLLFGSLLGRLAGLITLIIGGRRMIARHRWRDVCHVWCEYWRFPIIFAPSSLLNSLGLQLPLIVLTAVYGFEFAGQLGMAERIVAIPVTVIGTAVGQIFMAELAELRRSNSRAYLMLFLRLTTGLSVVAVLGLGALTLVADQLITTILGAAWVESVPLVQILALTGAVRLIATPLSGAIILFQRARANIVIDAVRIVLMSIAITSTVLYAPRPEIALWLIYGSLGCIYLITWIYVFSLLKSESQS
ncbi:O-antigen/teichoic acid export membrane protein [Glutamicibacter protophormiae]|uniref:O-antigen/teichoic acid export membrane protein n=2 Tax=Glutamicibacter protophormiae TaxID=37930 RepID=A0ABS4XS26_GLUPR|nr:O-antigen/teichoic acid export membrane protein [Glutamicibacter protophormiae]